MMKYVVGTIFIAFVAANNPPMGGSLEDLIHEIFTPPPDLSNKGSANVNQPGVIGQPGHVGQPGDPGHIPPQQPPIEANVSIRTHYNIHPVIIVPPIVQSIILSDYVAMSRR